ncbi:MAG: potassium channel family protein [Nitrospirae bacterium]|nr:potassium channel family protein [Nitrospirota bacterium]
MKTIKMKLLLSLGLIAFIVLFGTLGYIVIEGWNALDSLYMTIITIASVGFKEVHDLSSGGRIFTIILIISGAGTILFTLNTGAKFVLEGELQDILGRKRLEKQIKDLKGHYIICGYGRMGKIICKELRGSGVEFIIIEKMPNLIQEREDIILLEGDATQDEVLREAGIEKAKGLISVLPTDAENLYVVLTARGLKPDLTIVARAGEEGSEQKLLRAGADRVVSPYHIGGLRIAHTVVKPAVVDFIE